LTLWMIASSRAASICSLKDGRARVLMDKF
jgi:hypothetical protein